jgi:hypothetical protein
MLTATAIQQLVTQISEISALFAALASALGGLTAVVVGIRRLGQKLGFWRFLRDRYKSILRWFRSRRPQR